MAGDWLKFEHCTPSKPEVFTLAEQLGLGRDEVIGKLVRLWSWFDQNGNARSVTEKQVDEIGGAAGFARALVVVGWLRNVANGLRMVNYERHLGKGAKGRALSSRRSKTYYSRSQRENGVNREEKRREEKKEEQAAALPLPSWLPSEEWKAWLEVRQRIKAPNTRRALGLALKELERLRSLGQNPVAVLNSATLKGWRGLFPVKPEELTAAPIPSSARLCVYCSNPANAGNVGGIWHCREHQQDAFDGKPYPNPKLLT